MDILTKEERSKRMSLIRGKWTRQEVTIHNYLKGRRVRHRMHPSIAGSPDIIIPEKKIAIFLHGCFWHSCPKHYKKPVNNAAYWARKIRNNKIRDEQAIVRLKKTGWRVTVLWEHDMPASKTQKVIAELLPHLAIHSTK